VVVVRVSRECYNNQLRHILPDLIDGHILLKHGNEGISLLEQSHVSGSLAQVKRMLKSKLNIDSSETGEFLSTV
jgi:hypothetical protein